jgi:hypothetical protein
MRLKTLVLVLIAMLLIYNNFNGTLFAKNNISELDIDYAVIRILNPKLKAINNNSPVYRLGGLCVVVDF